MLSASFRCIVRRCIAFDVLPLTCTVVCVAVRVRNCMHLTDMMMHIGLTIIVTALILYGSKNTSSVKHWLSSKLRVWHILKVFIHDTNYGMLWFVVTTRVVYSWTLFKYTINLSICCTYSSEIRRKGTLWLWVHRL